MARPEALLERADEVEDLRLHGDVEGRDGFVRHQHVGIERQRPRDADALPLAAGEFVREAVRGLGRQADEPEEFAGAAQGRFGIFALGDRPLGDDLADPPARIERRVGILEHHLDPSPVRAELTLRQGSERHVADLDAAGIRLDETQHAAPDRGFAGAGFAHEAERLAAADREAHAFGGADLAPAPEEAAPAIAFGEVLHDERQRRAGELLGGRRRQ